MLQIFKRKSPYALPSKVKDFDSLVRWIRRDIMEEDLHGSPWPWRILRVTFWIHCQWPGADKYILSACLLASVITGLVMFALQNPLVGPAGTLLAYLGILVAPAYWSYRTNRNEFQELQQCNEELGGWVIHELLERWRENATSPYTTATAKAIDDALCTYVTYESRITKSLIDIEERSPDDPQIAHEKARIYELVLDIRWLLFNLDCQLKPVKKRIAPFCAVI